MRKLKYLIKAKSVKRKIQTKNSDVMKLNNFVFPPSQTIKSYLGNLGRGGENNNIQKKLVILEKKYGNSDSHNDTLQNLWYYNFGITNVNYKKKMKVKFYLI